MTEKEGSETGSKSLSFDFATSVFNLGRGRSEFNNEKRWTNNKTKSDHSQEQSPRLQHLRLQERSDPLIVAVHTGPNLPSE